MINEPIPLSLIAERVCAMLREADVAGVLLLVHPPCGHSLTHIETTWSCLRQVEGDLEMLSTASPEEQKRHLESTIHCMATFAQLAEALHTDCLQTLTALHEQLPANPATPPEP